MSKPELENLVRIRKLKEERPSRTEYDGMLSAAKTRLRDAQNEDLDPDSRFDLAYGAAHRLAAASLRREGYRSEDRITYFKRWSIPSARTRRTFRFSSKPTTSAILRSTKAAPKSTTAC